MGLSPSEFLLILFFSGLALAVPLLILLGVVLLYRKSRVLERQLAGLAGHEKVVGGAYGAGETAAAGFERVAGIRIVAMTLAHYESVLALWQQSAGVGLSAADEKAAIARYLQRNAGLSFVALHEDAVVGAVLCGHDGRRGFVHHLAVAAAYRRRGIGRALVQHCIASLQAQGIDKCHLFVFHENHESIVFWQALGWQIRDDIAIMSRYINESA